MKKREKAVKMIRPRMRSAVPVMVVVRSGAGWSIG
jgi:hypothetical protein